MMAEYRMDRMAEPMPAETWRLEHRVAEAGIADIFLAMEPAEMEPAEAVRHKELAQEPEQGQRVEETERLVEDLQRVQRERPS